MHKFNNPKVLFYSSFIVIGLILFFAHFSSAEKDSAKPTFENTVIPYEKAVADADYYFEVISWNANLHSDDDGLAKLQDKYEGGFNSTINDESNFKRIKSLRDDYIKKGVTGEQRDLSEKWYKYLDKLIVIDPAAKKLQNEELAMKNKISTAWNVYRPQMKDKNGKTISDPKTGKEKLFNISELTKILSQGKDREERKRAFEAYSSIGNEMEKAGFRDLIKKRNEFAKARGYKDYYNMKYAFAGFDEDKLFSIFDKFVEKTDTVTQDTVKKFLKERHLAKFEPWDIDFASQGFTSLIDPYLPKDGMGEVLKATFKDAGIDLGNFNIKMDLEPRAGKFPHAACWAIKFADLLNGNWKGEDVRLMANLDRGGIDQYSTLIHETGHAVHNANVRQKYEFDKNLNLTSNYEMGGITEGIAMTFEKLAEQEEWFVKYANFTKKKTKDDIAKLRNVFRTYEKKSKPWGAFNARVLLVKVYFERQLYKNPDADLNKIWWDAMQKLLFVERHDELAHWGHKMHFIAYPVYYQFYIIADFIASQDAHHFKTKDGKLAENPNFGKEMVEYYFKPGNTVPWETMLKNLTGETLNPQYKIDDVTKF